MTPGWGEYYENRLKSTWSPEKGTDHALIALARTWRIGRVPRPSQLTDEWRRRLRKQLRAKVVQVALRVLDDVLQSPLQPAQHTGKPKGAWTKDEKLKQGRAAKNRRKRRRDKPQK